MTTIIRSLPLLLILFLVWLLNESFQEAPVDNLPVTTILGTEKIPDYYSETLQLKDFNESGELQSLVNTTRLIHYPDQQHALLESPELVMYGENGDIWKVTSSVGKIIDETRFLTLSNNVFLSMFDHDERQKVIIKTTELHYDPEERLLWTDHEVFAESGNGIFNSRGLQILLKSEQIYLNNKVRIHYDL